MKRKATNITVFCLLVNLLLGIINIGFAYHSYTNADYICAYEHIAVGSSNFTAVFVLILLVIMCKGKIIAILLK